MSPRAIAQFDLNILYHHRTLADGAEGIHIREIIAAFRALGHDVRVAALVGEAVNGQNRKEARWSWVTRYVPRGAYELAEMGYNVVGRRRLLRAAADFHPDFIYDRYNTFSTAAVEAAKSLGVPLILEVNSPLAYERSTYHEFPLTFSRLAARYERRIFNAADHVIVVSTPLRDFLVAQRGVDESRISVLANGADPDCFRPLSTEDSFRGQLGLAGRIVVGFVGILRPWHGIDMLMDAFSTLAAKFDNAHLLIIGDGPLEQSLRARAAALELGDRVTFAGRVAHADVPAYVAAMDIAVSPRATFYASPMKILEYMAMRVPVVAPRMANIEDILEDGESGLLFEPEDPESLAGVLARLMEDAELRDRLAATARRQIEDRYNWRYNAERVVEIVAELETRRMTGSAGSREAM